MASIGKLVAAIADAEGIDEGTVKLIARYAREAGFISQGTYGPGAAKMTSTDAANLLIAVNASDLAKGAAAKIPIFRDLERSDYYTPALEAGYEAAQGSIDSIIMQSTKFGEFLSALIEGFMPVNGRNSSLHVEFDTGMFDVDLTFRRPLASTHFIISPRVSDDDEVLPRAHVTFFTNLNEIDPDQYPDRSDETKIGLRTLVAVAQTIAN